MKRVLLCVVILLAVFGAGIFTHITTERGATELLELLQQVETSAEQGEHERAALQAEEALGLWQAYSTHAHMYIEQNLMTYITASLGRIQVYATIGGEPLSAECSALRLLIEDLRQSQEPRLGNIL